MVGPNTSETPLRLHQALVQPAGGYLRHEHPRRSHTCHPRKNPSPQLRDQGTSVVVSATNWKGAVTVRDMIGLLRSCKSGSSVISTWRASISTLRICIATNRGTDATNEGRRDTTTACARRSPTTVQPSRNSLSRECHEYAIRKTVLDLKP
uniref:Uncharacterized protein n=1 Tax=Heterorhabditis bacteriophora TaxID=37862 RepID=A0A1I7W9I8_HETBA